MERQDRVGVELGFDMKEQASHNPQFDGEFDEEAIVAEGLDWRNQFSLRAVFVGICTGILLIFVSLTIGLSGAGVSPGYSITASLIGYAIMRPLTALLIKYYDTIRPSTPQENCIIQATATSIQSLVHALGVSSWLYGLHENVAAQLDGGYTNYTEWIAAKESGVKLNGVVDLSTGTMIGIALLIAFTGVLMVTVFKKLFIVDAKLPFPSPTATAVMINSLFTKDGRELALKQLRSFKIWAAISFFINLFNYLFRGDGCPALDEIPVFGVAGYDAGWYLSIGQYINFVGVGMIMSPNVSYSLILGAVLAYNAVYPSLYEHGGLMVNGTLTPAEAWFPTNVGGMQGFSGYKIMFTLMILLGDGLWALFLMSYIGFTEWRKKRSGVDIDEEAKAVETDAEREHRINVRIFTEDDVPTKVVLAMYAAITLLGAIVLPIWFKATWYMILIAFLLTPIFALVGNYIAGLTDWNVTSNFAKAAALIFGAWGVQVDPENAITISLMCCGIVYCGASNSTDIIGDFKTGFLTRTSPKGMFFAQIIGFTTGCIFTPIIFNLFVASAPDTGFPKSTGAKYPNTYGTIYRAMAALATTGGFDKLPTNTMFYSTILFFASFVSPLLKTVLMHFLEKGSESRPALKKVNGFVEVFWPTPMAVGIPFLVGTFFIVPVGIGLIANEIWKVVNRAQFENFYQIVAAGLLVGPGLWAIIEVIVTLAGGEPPLCLKYDLELTGPPF